MVAFGLVNSKAYHRSRLFAYLKGIAPRPVLNRLRQVWRLDGFTAYQIGNGARQLEDAVVRPRAHVQAHADVGPASPL